MGGGSRGRGPDRKGEGVFRQFAIFWRLLDFYKVLFPSPGIFFSKIHHDILLFFSLTKKKKLGQCYKSNLFLFITGDIIILKDLPKHYLCIHYILLYTFRNSKGTFSVLQVLT